MIKDRLLVVDDEEVIRTNLEKLLILEGYEVIEAADGESGTDVIKSYKREDDSGFLY